MFIYYRKRKWGNAFLFILRWQIIWSSCPVSQCCNKIWILFWVFHQSFCILCITCCDPELFNTVVSISQWRNRFLDTTSRCGGLWRWLRSSAQKQAKSQPVYETFPALSMFSAQCSALLLHWLHCTHICSISILIKSFKYSDKKAIKPTAV